MTQATALAYTSLLSLVPILAVAFFVFHAFGGFESLQDRLQPLIEENLAPAFSDQISQYLDHFVNNVHAGTIGVVGVIGFIFTSVSTLGTIERTFNMIWGSSKQRSWSKRITTYWSLLTIGPLLLGISIALSSSALGWLRADNGFIAHLIVGGFEVFPYLAGGILFTCLYLFMPNVAVDRRDALKAGLITGVVFELAKILYAVYAARSIAQNKIYGSLVIIPVFLVWLYVVWLVVLFGAELCCYFQFKRQGIPYQFNVEDRLNPFVIVDIIETLGAHHHRPKGGLTTSKLVEAVKLPLRQLMRHLDFLEMEGWILASRSGFMTGTRYYLAVPKERLDLPVILSELESRRYIPTTQTALDAYARSRQLWNEWARFEGTESERPGPEI